MMFVVCCSYVGTNICTSQSKRSIYLMIGDRLKSERERLGITQPVLAAQAGTKKGTVINWEKGASSPTAVQLEALAVLGVDVLYVVTGEKSPLAMNSDEQELVSLFRAAPLAVKAAAIGALKSAGGQQKNVQKVKKGVGQQFNAGVGTVTSGDITNSGKVK
ncbi:helix-turn-helix transcriptional regulator [Pseudomonas sp.]|uniref:helix-turn-helix domain-containing protein n=1 Tax=Pseudomonas sp. TaxID=306 RepID=UPI00324263BC